MFDDEVILLLRRNSDVMEIQAEKLAQAARGILDSINSRAKDRAVNNLVIIGKCLRKLNEEFAELAFLTE